MNRCSICGKETDKEFVNPVNPKDKAPYCEEHLASISRCFGNLKVLIMLDKNVWRANQRGSC